MDIYRPFLLEAKSPGRDIAGMGGFLPGRFVLLVAPSSPGSPGLGTHLSSLGVTWPPPTPLLSGCMPLHFGPTRIQVTSS